jgi:hypothetical protein
MTTETLRTRTRLPARQGKAQRIHSVQLGELSISVVII